MSIASSITKHFRYRGIARGRHAIYSVVADGDRVLCLTEPMLDTWWANLEPELKGEIYEAALGDPLEKCKFCGCRQSRACVVDDVPCAWLDSNHTVCSAPACALRFHLELTRKVFQGEAQLAREGDLLLTELAEILRGGETNGVVPHASL